MPEWAIYGLLGAVAGPAVIFHGKAVACRQPTSWNHAVRAEWFAMLVTGLMLSCMLAYVAWQQAEVAGVVAWLVIMGSLLSYVDWACHRLPHALVAVLLAGGVAQCGLLAAGQVDGVGRLSRAGVAALLVFLSALATWLASPGGWGGGDVTLTATLAYFLGWFGWAHVLIGLLIAFCLGMLAFVLMHARDRTTRGAVIPFGPALVFSSAGVVVLL
ncbi:prepilin peptidase [Lentzea sp. HUAS12]|uniref:prepilin peptidase n=1 Tax=Lentzea sp. HUAS12 TaxID=2951806 RepID=UPI00209FAFBA|nr:prepilin peptidase [Lentzea sp. HUAS12]USX56438.1 prepilin peptidase [Lentzea sp. HUAS12]